MSKIETISLIVYFGISLIVFIALLLDEKKQEENKRIGMVGVISMSILWLLILLLWLLYLLPKKLNDDRKFSIECKRRKNEIEKKLLEEC